MANKPSPIPEGYHTLTPFLVISNTKETLAFYEKGLGAKVEYEKFHPNGMLMHADLRIGDSRLMCGGETPEGDGACLSPAKTHKVSSALWIYCENVDEAYRKAIEAGARSTQEPMDAFWGDRLATVTDPSGHTWHFATHTEDVSKEEIDKRAEDFYKKFSQSPAQTGASS